jgi:repressor LexA
MSGIKSSAARDSILRYIETFRNTKGYSPTVREIARGCGISSPSVAHYHLNALERAGLLNREKEKFRSISLPNESIASVEVPLLGVIAAGHPIWAPDETPQTATEWIVAPAGMAHGNKSAYALRVKGNSMVDAMIADGDIVIMEQPVNVNNGDVVAVWLKNEQEVTLKKIYFDGEQVRLQPCNPYMMPIYHHASNVEVQGRVVGVLRTLKSNT